MHVVLASKSPRRVELLKKIIKNFDIIPSNVSEKQNDGETPEEYVLRLAAEKVLAVALSLGDTDSWIIGADTIVVLDGEVLEKPRTIQEARNMITRLQGNVHEVITGFCIMNCRGSKRVSAAIRTRVNMRKATEDEIEEYVSTGETFDKAGGYAIQGVGAQFIESIDGSFSNVVGLPIDEVRRALSQLGILGEATSG